MQNIAQRTKTKNMLVSIGLCLEDNDVATETTADADADAVVGTIAMQDSSASFCLLGNPVKSVPKRTRQSTLGVWQQTL